MYKINSVYLDNAASSFPKAPDVGEQMLNYINNIGANVGRSTHQNACDAAIKVFETRLLAKKLFNYGGPDSHIIFTPGATYALNQAILGFLSEEDHVIVSNQIHNAVIRPIRSCLTNRSQVQYMPIDENGDVDIDIFINMITPKTKMVVISHASNVCGTIVKIKSIADILREQNIVFILDASQTAGHIAINFDKLGLSALCLPAHKGIMGPQGLGLLVLSESFAKTIKPLIMGGTGNASSLEIQPDFLPDKFESGTQNIVGIYGLHAALTYILDKGITTIRQNEINLTNYFIKQLLTLNEDNAFSIMGTPFAKDRVGVISLNFKSHDNALIATILEQDYGIMTRSGLHCSPVAHQTLGSYPNGSLRFSLGHYNTVEEIDYTINALSVVLKEEL